ncbi:hypothetical protein PVAND_015638 [Polypedilum vanderplanki]|uniref:Ganglioside GM2 activator n=1 Tax=Polypedilum vanderplanki TaxID=319348 RepID=A0A9J6BCR6_POLVA|nr:hypothetical protein PVAND_015638 [Polypedilum vanderplanki]
MTKFFFILIFLFPSNYCKRLGIFFYKQPDLQFNINYINVSWDFTFLKNGTKEKPIEIIPGLEIVIMQDINQLQAQFYIHQRNTDQIPLNVNFNFCSISSKNAAGFFVRAIFELLLKSSNTSLKCPFKKGTIVNIANMDTKSLPASQMFNKNLLERATFLLKTGKKSTPFFSVTFYYTRVEVDD